MTGAEQRLVERGWVLPPAPRLPPGVTIPFEWVRVRGRRAFISGHGALSADGAPQGPFGRVPSEVSVEDAQSSARGAVLAMLASVRRALGSVDEVAAWLTISGFVNADPGYPQTTVVMNSASELILDLYGADAGAHARVAPGVVAVPFNLPVVISAEVELRPN